MANGKTEKAKKTARRRVKPSKSNTRKKKAQSTPLNGAIEIIEHQAEKEAFLKYFLQLPIQKLAAASIGKSEDTIVLWKKKDSYFSDQIAAAKSAWALSKVNGVRSVEWLLERVMKDHFAEKKEVEVGANAELEKALDRMQNILPKAGA